MTTETFLQELTRLGDIRRGGCRLSIQGDRYVMEVERDVMNGRHSLDVASTDEQRLIAHWEGYVANHNPAPALTEIEQICADMRSEAEKWVTLSHLYEGKKIAVDGLGRLVWRLSGGRWMLAQSTSLGRPMGLEMTARVQEVAQLADAESLWFHQSRDGIEGQGPVTIKDAGEHFQWEADEIRRLFKL